MIFPTTVSLFGLTYKPSVGLFHVQVHNITMFPLINFHNQSLLFLIQVVGTTFDAFISNGPLCLFCQVFFCLGIFNIWGKTKKYFLFRIYIIYLISCCSCYFLTDISIFGVKQFSAWCLPAFRIIFWNDIFFWNLQNIYMQLLLFMIEDSVSAVAAFPPEKPLMFYLNQSLCMRFLNLRFNTVTILPLLNLHNPYFMFLVKLRTPQFLFLSPMNIFMLGVKYFYFKVLFHPWYIIIQWCYLF